MCGRCTRPFLIGVTAAGISAAYLLYSYLRKKIRTSQPTSIEVKVPKDCVGAIIGRGGSSIKDIQGKSSTKIIFKRGLVSDAYQVCIIQGNQEGAQLAEALIRDIIANRTLTEHTEMLVPQHACARLIGRSGDTIRGISGTKITVEECGNSSVHVAVRRVVIKGTPEGIALAKKLIAEKVAKDIDVGEKMLESLDRRSPFKTISPQYLMSPDALQVEQVKQHSTECLAVSGKDECLEATVASLDHPGCFWVQLIGPWAIELDHLLEEMTEYYKQEENREYHALQEVKVNQVVAAPCRYDDVWYRARVTDVMLDDYDVKESLVTVHYVDYGDSDKWRKKDLCSLRADFFKLRFQAIACCLAKVKPREGDWTDEAIDLFEAMCHMAERQKIMLRVCSHKEQKEGEREGSPIHVVDLYDCSGTQDVFVAEALVKEGHATWESDCAQDRQKNVGAQLGQMPADNTEAASSGTKSNTVVEGQDVIKSGDCK